MRVRCPSERGSRSRCPGRATRRGAECAIGGVTIRYQAFLGGHPQVDRREAESYRGKVLRPRSLPLRAPPPLTSRSRSGRKPSMPATPDSDAPNIVLVHGAWADGSGWEGVYRSLSKKGFSVSVVQHP